MSVQITCCMPTTPMLQDFDRATEVRKQRAAVDEAFAQIQVRC